MRIVPVVSVLILTLATTSAFARRSRCRQVVCESAPVACCSATPSVNPLCVKPTTVFCTPQPATIALEEKAVPVAATAPTEVEAASAKRSTSLPLQDADTKLDAYLAEWEKASSKIHRLDCEFLKFSYDPIFEVEKRGRGTIAVEQDRRAKYRIAPAVLIPGEVSKKESKDGRPYALQACSAECWHWTGSELFKLDDQEHSYDKIDVHPRDESDNWGFLRFTEEQVELLFLKPFVLGMPADQLNRRFWVRRIKETSDELWLELIPRQPEESGCYQKAVLILDRRSWLPRALKMFDPTGSQTVHIFQNIKVNSADADDLSKTNLKGYRKSRGDNSPKTGE